MNTAALAAGWERRFSTAEGRWARLGPYYAMFPIGFAQQAVEEFTVAGDVVVDPFCGRGTTPYVAMVNDRAAVACDINPVAWVYAATKVSPADPGMVKRRVCEIAGAVSGPDRKPESEFQALAFCTDALGFINAARRELSWRADTVDRTVAAFLAHYLHTKIPQGLSNQMRHSRAMSPGYCIRWWREHGYAEPPEVDPVAFLHSRIDWRYHKGLPAGSRSRRVEVALGDAAVCLPSLPRTDVPASLVVTSPPYSAVTNYQVDSWLRLWALGAGPALPDWNTEHRYTDLNAYRRMIRNVFKTTAQRTNSETVWLVRSDARNRTFDVISAALAEIAGDRHTYTRAAPFKKSTQTALYGDQTPKPGEIDLLLTPHTKPPKGKWQPHQPPPEPATSPDCNIPTADATTPTSRVFA